MIITSKVARYLTTVNLKNKDDVFARKHIRQLRKIEVAIMNASKKGKLNYAYPDELYEHVIEVLRENNYKVTDCSTYKYIRYVISWEESK